MANCIGSVISVDCDQNGYYQGKLVAVDVDTKDITLASVFREGIPLGNGKTVTLNSSQIKSLKVLKGVNEVVTQPQKPDSTTIAQVTVPRQQVVIKKPAGAVQQQTDGRRLVGGAGPAGVQRSKSTSAMTVESNTEPIPQQHTQSNGYPNNGSLRTNSWQVRPLNNGKYDKTQNRNHPSTSSSEEGIEQERRKERNTTRTKTKPLTNVYSFNGNSVSNNKPHTSDGSDSPAPVVECTPTPLFKKFEPQVPNRQTVTPRKVIVNGAKASKKEKGPCGIPILDAKNAYGRVSDKNNELNKPIDFGLLDTDFDFDANLELFDRERATSGDADEEEYYEKVEKPKMSQNFAHYENILSDPARITSWTSLTGGSNSSHSMNKSQKTIKSKERRSPVPRAVLFCPSSTESTSDGLPIPVLDAVLKKQYIKECELLLGEDVYQAMVADKLFTWAIDVIQRYNVSQERIVILTSSTASTVLTDRLISHIDNRGLNATVCGFAPGIHLASISAAMDVNDLPENPTLIMVLSENLSTDVIEWMSSKEAHVVALEYRPKDIDASKLHILCIGVLTSGVSQATLQEQKIIGRTSFAILCAAIKQHEEMKKTDAPDVAICDLGTPYSWIAEEGRAQLQQAFARSLLVRL